MKAHTHPQHGIGSTLDRAGEHLIIAHNLSRRAVDAGLRSRQALFSRPAAARRLAMVAARYARAVIRQRRAGERLRDVAMAATFARARAAANPHDSVDSLRTCFDCGGPRHGGAICPERKAQR